MKINKYILFSLTLVIGFFLTFKVSQAQNLAGKILLQVEEQGQAWYLNPLNNERYYLGRPEQAFLIMRQLGLGVTNKDLNIFLNSQAPSRLAGRILLQVEEQGQAYYVEPSTLKLYYLGRPSDAFRLMSSLGLGISNSDLQKIAINVEFLSDQDKLDSGLNLERKFIFKYNGNYLSIDLKLSSNLFQSYQATPKVLEYQASKPPLNLQEAFYEILLTNKKGDNSINEISLALKDLAQKYNLNDDALVELVLALVQYIPYDDHKALNPKIGPYFPYETLYLNKGVCSDTTFLAYKILQNLNYGVAILDFPNINHSALGIACPKEDSIANSSYCYAETTNYFPIGVIPNTINGQASSNDYGFSTLFSENKLGKIEIFNKSSGKLYYGVRATKKKVQDLNNLYQDIVQSRDKLSNNQEIRIYNNKVETFNVWLKDLYQK